MPWPVQTSDPPKVAHLVAALEAFDVFAAIQAFELLEPFNEDELNAQ